MLLSLPLWFSLLALTAMPFMLNVILSLTISIFISDWLARTYFSEDREKDYFVLAVATSFTALYMSKTYNGILDAICPTGLISMTTQISNQRFPTSFPAFPEVVANYHQGFVILTGIFKWLVGISAYGALEVVILCGVFFTLLWMGDLLRESKTAVLTFAISLWMVGSLPTENILPLSGKLLDFEEYLIPADLLRSSSFLWGLLTLIFFHRVLKKQDIEQKWHWSLLAYVLLISSLFNPTVYSLALFLLLIDLGMAYKNSKDKFTSHWVLFALAPLFLALLLPQFLPTVFRSGKEYSHIMLSRRYLTGQIGDLFYYLRICGLVLALGLAILFKKDFFRKHLFLGLSFIFCFLFPIFIESTNIGRWDNFHKFAGLVQIFSILFFCLLIKEQNLIGRKWQALYALVLLTSFPSFWNQLSSRTASDFSVRWSAGTENTAELRFLEKMFPSTMLYGYGVEGRCDALDALANLSGAFLRTSYYDAFLLNEDFDNETYYLRNWWAKPKVFKDVIENRLNTSGAMIAIPVGKLSDFRKSLSAIKPPPLFIREFKTWAFISKSPLDKDWQKYSSKSQHLTQR